MRGSQSAQTPGLRIQATAALMACVLVTLHEKPMLVIGNEHPALQAHVSTSDAWSCAQGKLHS